VSAFGELAERAPQRIWERIAARSVHGERITSAVVELDPGALVAPHSHANWAGLESLEGAPRWP